MQSEYVRIPLPVLNYSRHQRWLSMVSTSDIKMFITYQNQENNINVTCKIVVEYGEAWHLCNI